MGGDYSRDSFDALRDSAALLLQQGRPVTDSDWNEMVATLLRRQRTETVDTIGRAVVPRETPTGFEIRRSGGTLEIGRGRKYLSGLLLECHGSANFNGTDNSRPLPVLDRSRNDGAGPEGVLDELISPQPGDFLNYLQQPYWPVPAPVPTSGRHLAYIVGWNREITALHTPELLEPALGGIDTSSRLQTVWQVRLAENISPNTTCATPDENLGIAGWEDDIAPSTARLNTDTIAIEDPENPCLVPPTDGYTGLENQLYRVELHTVGDNQADAFFKFSRENASVVAAIETIAASANRLTVDRIGRDEILRFREGDWVEVTDDHREFNHQSGQMLRVAVVNEEAREIELEGTIAGDLIPSGTDGDTLVNRHSRLIRWDQRSIIRLEDGSEWVDLDTAPTGGLIPVPPEGARVVLESGIVVSFSTVPGNGRFREMDYWMFAARTAGTQIERLRQAPPDGIHRHYSRLAILPQSGAPLDCRVFWPPEFEGEGCACTVCVTAEGHNSGALTIQAAIDQIGQSGGTVCLDGGNYFLQSPILIQSRQAIKIEGQGMRTVLRYAGNGAAVQANRAIDLQLERFSLLITPSSGTEGTRSGNTGIHLTHCVTAAIRRVTCLALGSSDFPTIGLAVSGISLALKIEECLILASVAIGALVSVAGAIAADNLPRSAAFAELTCIDNILFGSRTAIRFAGAIMNIGSARFSHNLVFGLRAGVQIGWFEPVTGATSFDNNTLYSGGDACAFSAGNLRLQDNEISGGSEDNQGVILLPSFVPDTKGDAQIIGNRIGNLGGSGIRIEAPMAALLIKRNIIRQCGIAGILQSGKTAVDIISIDNNIFEDISENSNEGGAILLSQTLEGSIAKNSIRNVGGDAAATGMFAGIFLRGSRQVSVEGNSISGLHRTATTALVSGIAASVPFRTLSIQNNQVTGAETNNDAGQSWTGIEVGDNRVPTNATTGTDLARLTTFITLAGEDALLFVEFSGETVALTVDRVLTIGPIIERQVTVNANQVQHAGNSIRPLVAINGPGQVSCIFTNNQCQLNNPGSVAAIVSITAPRIIASNNVVRRQSDQDAMALFVGRQGRATVIGNLTFGNIRLTPPGNLPAPFNALNLIAQ